MFAGLILADVEAKDHAPVEIHGADSRIAKAFELAGQDKFSSEELVEVQAHRSVAYLRFPSYLPDQYKRIASFSDVLQRAGGIAVKVESSGVAHTWRRWQSLLTGSLFDNYCAVVTLIREGEFYYSCGMHLFGLPECEVPTHVSLAQAADLMNRFNFWQIAERPILEEGHTFSVSQESPRYRLNLIPDARHEQGELFHNPLGVWRLGVA